MSTDLARLVVALEAQTAKYQEGLDAANRKLSKFSRDQETLLGGIDKQFKNFGSGIKGAIGGLLAGISFKGIIDATSEAGHAFALLDNAVKASGGSAGYTTQQLSDMADELSKITTYDNGAIKGAEQLLLRFQSIRGVNFKNATKETLNLAAALGKDLPEAALLVGKALEDPEKGLTQLARAGVVFGDSQKKIIEGLVNTGQTERAQAIILQELEARYGGAAEAARDTFGGALTALHNAFNSLLEGGTGMSAATDAVNELTDVLNSPEVKQGFEAIVAGFLKVIEVAAKAAAGLADFSKWVGESIASMHGDGPNDLVRMSETMADLQGEIKSLQELGGFGKFMNGGADSVNDQIKKLQLGLDYVTAKYEAARKAAADLFAEQHKFDGLDEVKVTARHIGGKAPKDSALDAIDITARKDPLGINSPMAKFYDNLQKQSETATEKQLADFAEVESALNELYASGKIGADEYTERFNEAFDKMVPEVKVTAKKIGPALIEQFDYIGKMLRDFVAKTNDIIAGGLEDAMNGHFDNILKDFEHLLQQMVAKSIASDITGALFGDQGGGKGQGFLGGALDFLGKAFGGSRDVGGAGEKGKVYKIGTGAQPEYFSAPSDGTFHPRGAGMGGGAVVNQVINVQGQVTEYTARQIALQSAQRQRAAMRLS